MAHFYGTVQGFRGEASRLGSLESGMEVYCASWNGAVRCKAWYNSKKKIDILTIELVPWQGNGVNKLLYEGPAGGTSQMKKKNQKKADSFLKTVGMAAKIGELLTSNQKESNDWKAQMLKTGLENRGLIMPEDWNELTEKEKQRRLDGAIKEITS
mgnify:CR=1 FL=1